MKVFDRGTHRSSWKSRPAKYKNNHDVLDPFDTYDLNLKMVLTMQQMGKAEASSESIRSSLGIESTAVKGYSTYEQKISPTHIRLAERILQEILEQEIEATRKLNDYEGDENRKCGLRMAIDTGWTQRASGRCYKSPAGQILGQGLAAGRFVGVTAIQQELC
jgi:hypothetical protein